MIQLWLELTTTGSAKKLLNMVKIIDQNEFETLYSFVENTNDVIYAFREDKRNSSCEYVIVQENDSLIVCLQLVGMTINRKRRNGCQNDKI